MTSKKTIKSAFESMMFVWGEPLDAKVAAEVFNIEAKDAYEYFKELQGEYEQGERGIVIREVNKSFQFTTRAENSEYIERLCTPVREKRLSQSALEVLAIVAYKQPVTKGEIESVRGIKCDRVIEGLSKKGLIQEAGRSTGIGRPILYKTTDSFLKNFGFQDIKELPDIEDLAGVINAKEDPDEEAEWQQIAIELPDIDQSDDSSGLKTDDSGLKTDNSDRKANRPGGPESDRKSDRKNDREGEPSTEI